MSTPGWPEGLPRKALKNDFDYRPQSGVIRTSMDAGYAKVRRRFTASTELMTVSFTMSYDQFKLFEIFFYSSPNATELAGIAAGAVPFLFPRQMWVPAEGQVESDRPGDLVRIYITSDSEPYTATPDGDSIDWLVSFTIERLP